MQGRSLQEITLFNTYILDLSDTLWRYRAFNASTQNAKSVYRLIDFVQEQAIQVNFVADEPDGLSSSTCSVSIWSYVV